MSGAVLDLVRPGDALGGYPLAPPLLLSLGPARAARGALLDGNVAAGSVALEDGARDLPGMGWVFDSVDDGSWRILNQGLENHLLGAPGGQSGLYPARGALPGSALTWRLYAHLPTGMYALSPGGGGWLSLTEEGHLTLSALKTPQISDAMLWRIAPLAQARALAPALPLSARLTASARRLYRRTGLPGPRRIAMQFRAKRV